MNIQNNCNSKLDRTHREAVDAYAFAFLTIFSLVATLTFHLLT